MAINGLKLGDEFFGDTSVSGGIDVRDNKVFGLSYYPVNSNSEDLSGKLNPTNLISKSGIDIGDTKESIVMNLGDNYGFIPEEYFRISSPYQKEGQEFIYIDHENELMLYYLYSSSSRAVVLMPEKIFLEPLDAKKMVGYPKISVSRTLLTYSYYVHSVLGGNAVSMDFYIIFPIINTLLFISIVNFFRLKRQKRWLILPIALAVQYLIIGLLIMTYGSMR